MTEAEFDKAFEAGELDSDYIEFLFDRESIGNGEVALAWIADGVYDEAFRDHMVTSDYERDCEAADSKRKSWREEA